MRPESPLPDPLPPLRPTDAEGALVRPPTEELFPGGSAAEPWEPGGAGDELAFQPRHEEHRLAVRPTSGVRVWAISFAAGVP
jgi:hypothetical protein